MQRDIKAGVQKMARVMEKYIRQYPDQWLMFQPIWDEQWAGGSGQ
jgi:lauroyl/myristoyl acyltransferase